MLKRYQPVRIVFQRLAKFGELLVPDGIGDLHGHLVSQLSFTVYGEALVSDAPGLIFIFTGDDPDSHPGIDRLIWRLILVLSGRLGILDRYGSHRFRLRQPGLRRTRNENAREEP